MTPDEVKTACKTVLTTSGTNLELSPTIAAYMVQSEPYGVVHYGAVFPERQPGPDGFSPWFTTLTTTRGTVEEEEDTSEARPLSELRELLNKLALFLSGIGEYPEELGEMFDAELLSQDTPAGPDYTLIPERAILLTLMWALGELDFTEEQDVKHPIQSKMDEVP